MVGNGTEVGTNTLLLGKPIHCMRRVDLGIPKLLHLALDVRNPGESGASHRVGPFGASGGSLGVHALRADNPLRSSSGPAPCRSHDQSRRDTIGSSTRPGSAAREILLVYR